MALVLRAPQVAFPWSPPPAGTESQGARLHAGRRLRSALTSLGARAPVLGPASCPSGFLGHSAPTATLGLTWCFLFDSHIYSLSCLPKRGRVFRARAGALQGVSLSPTRQRATPEWAAECPCPSQPPPVLRAAPCTGAPAAPAGPVVLAAPSYRALLLWGLPGPSPRPAVVHPGAEGPCCCVLTHSPSLRLGTPRSCP